MPTIAERIATIESQFCDLREKFQTLEKKYDEMNASQRNQEITVNTLRGDITRLTDALEKHNDAHDKLEAKKFNWGNLIISMLLAFLTIVIFVQQQTAKEVQTQIITFMKENNK